MKKTIAIVAGGDSSEHDVSLRSAAGIYSWIDKEKYDAYIVEISHSGWVAHLPNGKTSPVYRHNFSFKDEWLKDIKPDYAYITIHGTPGEDGVLQGYFDLLSIPYSTSGVLIESLTFNKFALNQFLKTFGVKVAEDILVRQGQEIDPQQIADKVGLPCFIKPNGIALQSRLVDDTGILQDFLLEADAAQQFALLTLGSMILEILAEVTLVASLSNCIANGWQLYVYHVLKFGHELIVAFLRHIFHFSLFSSFLLFLMNDDF